MASYADDTTPYVYGENISSAIESLEKHITFYFSGSGTII